MAVPVIALKGVSREFPSGEGMISAIADVDLTIEAGELVAIVGASGSGKSTLMNILGCLDRPTSGSYEVRGREMAALNADELAALRREHFGFIFQRYHLLPELTAAGNVEVPAVYSGQSRHERELRAVTLLRRLGVGHRGAHRPSQLSGGEQQRISIARALMNDAEVILADEPTGALDSRSGELVLRILEQLHAERKTVIIVTHDMTVAARAERIIEISDGKIVSDRRTKDISNAAPPSAATNGDDCASSMRRAAWLSSADRYREALRMALLSMNARRARTFLTMLGIIIGIASVVCVVALGEGSRRKVLSNISSLGTNTLEIFPGKDFGDVRSSKIKTLTVADIRALAEQPYVAAVTPTVSTSSTLRFNSTEANALVNGVGEHYFEVKGATFVEGRGFDADSARELGQDVVIDENTRKTFFTHASGGAVGKILLIGKVPCRVVGVIRPQQSGFGSSQNLSVYLPYTTVQARFLGDRSLRSMILRVKDDAAIDIAEQATRKSLIQRHGTQDFFIINTEDIRNTITSTAETLALLIAAIAIIALVVGGIGVMNIMLVSVSERTNEIGVRMAVGARRSDILQQFLIEAVIVCLVGGVLGIGAALSFGVVFGALGSNFNLVYSGTSIVVACFCSTLIGVVFGYLPARNASLLDPVVALARD